MTIEKANELVKLVNEKNYLEKDLAYISEQGFSVQGCISESTQERIGRLLKEGLQKDIDDLTIKIQEFN